MKDLLTIFVEIASEAGEAIMKIYEQADHGIQEKPDKSPLTLADKASNQIINSGLRKAYPDIPIISEENQEIPYSVRKSWTRCWIVDPLDGTKEFIKRNGEFTINIALVEDGRPIAGMVYVPVTRELYFARKGEGAWRQDAGGQRQPLQVCPPDDALLIMAESRSHPSAELEKYRAQRTRDFREVRYIQAGSALKFCLVASGKAHEYPRLGPTMEWDTAAGQAIVEAAGGKVLNFSTREPLMYNKEDLHNPPFIVTA